jgi:prolyl oligopeptidase PreP (S9A serine peptidase family)
LKRQITPEHEDTLLNPDHELRGWLQILVQGFLFVLFMTFVAGFAHAEGAADENSCVSVFSDKTVVFHDLNVSHDPATLNPVQRDWLNARNAEVNKTLAKSANLAKIEDRLKVIYNVETLTKELDLDGGGRKIKLVDRGLGEPEDVVISTAAEGKIDRKTDVKIFSNFEFRRNNSFNITDMSLSHDKKTLVLAIEEDGSLDDFTLVVIDIQTRAVLTKELKATSAGVAWISENEFLYSKDQPPHEGRLGRFNRLSPSTETVEDGNLILGSARNGVSWIESNWAGFHSDIWKLVNKDGRSISLANGSSFKYVVGEVADGVIVHAAGETGLGSLYKISLETSPAVPKPFYQEQSMLLERSEIKDGFVINRYRWGGSHWIHVLNSRGEKLSEIEIPSCCNVGKISWTVLGKKLEIKLSSAISKSKAFIYDIGTGTWDRNTFEDELLTVGGVQYVSELVEYPSIDGTMIPMRIVRRKDLPRNGKNPVFMKVYGGFNLTGSIDTAYEGMNLEFVSRGGILAAPALRGGNELGPDWHEAGMLKNKINTMRDLIAASRYLKKQKWSTGSKIATSGASNGGFVVASAGLLSAKDFGLVIPIAGVHDQINKEVLDYRFDGWVGEWGDSRIAEDRAYMIKTSPVELAKTKPIPKTLLLVGQYDSRVNPFNSYRLAETLRLRNKAGKRMFLYQVKNSGHWLQSATYQDLIGWRVNSVMWTSIFDTFGMVF